MENLPHMLLTLKKSKLKNAVYNGILFYVCSVYFWLHGNHGYL